MENGVECVHGIGGVEVPAGMTAVTMEGEFTVASEEEGEFRDNFYTFRQKLVGRLYGSGENASV